MITIKEAIQIALSDELNENEKKAFNLITKHIDTKIRENFNGEMVDIQIDGSYISDSTFYLSQFITKPWRRDIVSKKWRREYEAVGWKIEDKEGKDGYGRKIICHNFSVDPSYHRDKKLNELLS